MYRVKFLFNCVVQFLVQYFLEMLDVRVSSSIKSKEKMAVSLTKCESWRSRLSDKCRCLTWTMVFKTCR